MYSLVINKSSNKIVLAHNDGSVRHNIPTPEEQLLIFCDNNNLNVNDFFAIEYPWDKRNPVDLSRHIYNPATGLVEDDPNWVATPPVEPPPPAPTETS